MRVKDLIRNFRKYATKRNSIIKTNLFANSMSREAKNQSKFELILY